MLEGLDKINWSDKGNRTLAGPNIPATIKDLVSPDLTQVKKAAELLRYVAPGGYVAPFALDLIEFLVEIVQSEQTPYRIYALQVLEDIAESTESELNWDITYKGVEQRIAELLEFKHKLQTYIPAFLNWTEDNDANIRYRAAIILLTLEDDSDQTLLAIWSVIQRAPDDRAKNNLLFGVSDGFLSRGAKYAYLFEQLIESNESNIVKASAASVLAVLSGSETPQRIIDLMIEGFSLQPAPLNLFNGIRALEPLKAVPAFLQAIKISSDDRRIHNIIINILNIIFPGKSFALRSTHTETSPSGKKVIYKNKTEVITKLEVKELSIYQQDVLQVLAKLDNAWSFPSDYLELYGLPSTQAELKTFLAQA